MCAVSQSEDFHLQHSFQALIENNLYTVGGVAIGIALSQVFSLLVNLLLRASVEHCFVFQLLVIWLARTLEGQIESQKALWTYN